MRDSDAPLLHLELLSLFANHITRLVFFSRNKFSKKVLFCVYVERYYKTKLLKWEGEHKPVLDALMPHSPSLCLSFHLVVLATREVFLVVFSLEVETSEKMIKE